MIIYNVTVKISHEKHDDWVAWMKNVHVPEVMATGMFSNNIFSRVMMEDEEGTNYSIQYYCDNLETLQKYQDEYAAELQKAHTERYKEHFVAFRTLLEVI